MRQTFAPQPRQAPPPFKRACFADWLNRVAAQDHAGLAKHYGTVRKTAMAESGSGALGGYAVPPDWAADLIKTVAEKSVLFKAKARQVAMKTLTKLLPYPDPVGVPAAGTSQFFGGMTFTWTAEAQKRPESEPKWRTLELEAHEASAYLVVSNALAQDADGIDSWLKELISDGVAWTVDFACFQGTGVGQPLGILNSPAIIAVAGRSSSAITAASVANMCKVLLPGSWETSCFFCNPGVLADLVALANSWYLNASPDDGGPFGWLANRPLYVTEKLPARGTTGDIVLVDTKKYVVGLRQDVTVDVSMDEPTAMLNNQRVWRVIVRVDGQPLVPQKLTLDDGATSASAYVSVA